MRTGPQGVPHSVNLCTMWRSRGHAVVEETDSNCVSSLYSTDYAQLSPEHANHQQLENTSKDKHGPFGSSTPLNVEY